MYTGKHLGLKKFEKLCKSGFAWMQFIETQVRRQPEVQITTEQGQDGWEMGLRVRNRLKVLGETVSLSLSWRFADDWPLVPRLSLAEDYEPSTINSHTAEGRNVCEMYLVLELLPKGILVNSNDLIPGNKEEFIRSLRNHPFFEVRELVHRETDRNDSAPADFDHEILIGPRKRAEALVRRLISIHFERVNYLRSKDRH